MSLEIKNESEFANPLIPSIQIMERIERHKKSPFVYHGSLLYVTLSMLESKGNNGEGNDRLQISTEEGNECLRLFHLSQAGIGLLPIADISDIISVSTESPVAFSPGFIPKEIQSIRATFSNFLRSTERDTPNTFSIPTASLKKFYEVLRKAIVVSAKDPNLINNLELLTQKQLEATGSQHTKKPLKTTPVTI